MSNRTAVKKVTSPRKRREEPRAPSRGRGIARFAALLDATETLLLDHDPNAIGLYQIAEQADVPPASVYHFFPTKEAAYRALAERLADQLLEIHHTPIKARSIGSWMDLFRIDARRAMDFYNSKVPALKIFYGGYGGVEGREVDRVIRRKIAVSNYDRLSRIFHMPHLGDPNKLFEIRLCILDAIWELSVRRHGSINESYFEESYRAVIAYSRLYLPDLLEPTELLLRATKKGESIVLTFDAEPARLAK